MFLSQHYKLLQRFPKSVRELFERHALDETPQSDDPAFIHAAGGRFFQTRLCSRRQKEKPGSRISGSKSTTLATIGITREQPTIYWISCGNCGAPMNGCAFYQVAK